MDEPLVSVITPSYNSEKFITDTIRSILNQTYQNLELVITDDCSSDGTVERIEKIIRQDSRVQLYFLNKNSGPGVARNNSIEKAKGKFIAFCDSDDQWKPDKLKKQISHMVNNDLALSFTSYDIVDESGEARGKVNALYKVDYNKMLKNNYIGCLTAMYDAEKLGKMYMPEIRKRQDWALWLMILKKTKYAQSIPEALSIYRQRKASISKDKFGLIGHNFNLYNKVLGYKKLKSAYLLVRFLFFYFRYKKFGF